MNNQQPKPVPRINPQTNIKPQVPQIPIIINKPQAPQRPQGPQGPIKISPVPNNQPIQNIQTNQSKPQLIPQPQPQPIPQPKPQPIPNFNIQPQKINIPTMNSIQIIPNEAPQAIPKPQPGMNIQFPYNIIPKYNTFYDDSRNIIHIPQRHHINQDDNDIFETYFDQNSQRNWLPPQRIQNNNNVQTNNNVQINNNMQTNNIIFQMPVQVQPIPKKYTTLEFKPQNNNQDDNDMFVTYYDQNSQQNLLPSQGIQYNNLQTNIALPTSLPQNSKIKDKLFEDFDKALAEGQFSEAYHLYNLIIQQ